MGKKGVDMIDYTFLQKKGMIKKEKDKKSSFKVNSQGLIDLTSATSEQVNAANTSENSNPFSFLDNLAQGSGEGSSSNGLLNSSSEQGVDNVEVSSLKIKIDDLEYKISTLVDKLSMIESKLENFEKRVLS